MARYFTLDQAARLLPEVEKLLRRALTAHRSAEQAEAELAEWTRKVTMSGGMRLDPGQIRALREQHETSARTVQESLETLNDLGVQVKDLNVGLLDFPTLYRGEEVLLCWRLGEAAIEYWHGLEDGFAGRRRIDRDFLDHHRGSDAH